LLGTTKLVFEDGTTFGGTGFGADRVVGGEVVFNTAMTGYPETLTDPAYRGQILVLANPLQGNYGVARGPFESKRIQVQGLVIAQLAASPHHHSCVQTLGSWLAAGDVPGILEIDTRAVVGYLRDHGPMRGFLLRTGTAMTTDAERVDMTNVVALVEPREVRRYEAGPCWVLAIDTGMRESAILALLRRGISVLRYPASGPWHEALPHMDGVLLGSGPGDPTHARPLVERLSRLFQDDLPIFGICLGHQLLALAAGASTQQLAHGHRSSNQPVLDLRTQRAYSTSQNHGYAVDAASLPPAWEAWCVNLHDGSNEGIRPRSKPWVGVQFHPEAAAGPRDTAFLFDEFVALIHATRRRRGLADD
jgi:carbamoyl-phosphate synthase small subunit